MRQGVNTMLPKDNMPAANESVKMRTGFVVVEKR